MIEPELNKKNLERFSTEFQKIVAWQLLINSKSINWN